MLRRILFVLIVLSFGLTNHIFGQARPLVLEDLFRIQRISDPVVSPDGKWVVFTVASSDLKANKMTTDLWISSIDGKTNRQLTSDPTHDRHATWAPDSRSIAFESTRSGKSQIWTMNLEGGEAKQITNISTEATQPLWSPDGKNIAFVSSVFPEYSELPFQESEQWNKRIVEEREKAIVKARIITNLMYRHWDSWVDGKRQHLFIQPVQGGDPRDITPGNHDAIPTSSTFSGGIDFAFSPDGSQIAYTVPPSKNEAMDTNHDVHLVSVTGGKPSSIAAGPTAEGYPRFSPNGRYIAFRAQKVPGYEADRWQLYVYDRTTGQSHSITESFDGIVETPAWAADSKSLFFTAEEKGNRSIFRANVSSKGEVKRILERGSNSSLQVTSDGKMLIFVNESAVHPAEVYRSNTDGKNVQAITGMNRQLFGTLNVPAPESIWYAGEGNTKVQAWLFKPPVFNPARKYPLVLLIHGGPQGAWLNAWSYRWNPALWAAQGYVVLAPNPRGSTGFGQKFHR